MAIFSFFTDCAISFFLIANKEVISSISISGSFILFQTKSGLFGSFSGSNKTLVHCKGLTFTFNLILGFVGWGPCTKTGAPGGPGGRGTPGGAGGGGGGGGGGAIGPEGSLGVGVWGVGVDSLDASFCF